MVTGGAKGIGFAIARCLARAGALVVLSDIDGDALAKSVSALEKEGGKVQGYTCDVADSNSVESWIESCRQNYSTLDILVNNAAICFGASITEMPEADWNKILNTNLTSAFRTIQGVLPAMLEQKSGSVINLSSLQGHRSYDDFAAYAAAKGGLIAMTRQLAGQYGSSGVRFNCISPGAINTPLNLRRAREEGEAFVRASSNMHAIPRMGDPDEVAQAALFLASETSSFITGHDLLVDGGLSTLPRYFE